MALGNEPVRVDGEIAGPGHHGRLRLHGRALDRVRLPAARAVRAGHGGGARHLRQLGRRARWRASRCSIRAASGYAARREPPPYDEAYDESGAPRPQYAELLDALGDPGRGWRSEVKRRLRERGVTLRRRARRRSSPSTPCRGSSPRRSGPSSRPASGSACWPSRRSWRTSTARVACSRPGVLTREDVEASPHYEPAMRGVTPAALDLVRRPRRGALRGRPLPGDRGPGADAVGRRVRRGDARDASRAPAGRAAAARPLARLRRARARASRRRPAGRGRAAHGAPLRGAVGRGLVGARAAGARAVRPAGHARRPRAARRPPGGLDRRAPARRRRGLPAHRRGPLHGADGSPTAIGEALLGPAAAGDARGRERARLGHRRRQARARARGRADPLLPRTRSRSCRRSRRGSSGPTTSSTSWWSSRAARWAAREW